MAGNSNEVFVSKLGDVEPNVDYKDIIIKISSLIDSGELKPGQRLPGERLLAEHFNVGRDTVRTALKFLEFIGVIETKVGKGAFVSKEIKSLATVHLINLVEIIKDNPFNDLLEARKAIETKMAALAATNATPEDVRLMKDAIIKMEKEIKENGRGVDPTDMFHLAIYKASKNIILYKIGVMLQELMHESRELTLQEKGRPLKSLNEHKLILEAITKHDSQRAAQLMEEHLMNVERILAKKGKFE